ncbi:hypothetical protein GIB67_004006 [Kingdonia uniflora]|uniref:Fungal lipase-type domain-containing protein n=1 Tax=Kingdonia uniflora TaxID=39325 RepID=A0A7J7NRN0_9MAGN|nr:hypothetical protein GIB67_004006 [Kingdonia uniflora]
MNGRLLGLHSVNDTRTIEPHNHNKHNYSLAKLLTHLDFKTQPSHTYLEIHTIKTSTPTTSPKEDISTKWREIHGSTDYENLLEPLQPWVRREIVKYGEFAQATYDAFDFDAFSNYCGSCKYNPHKLFGMLGLSRNGYKVTNYIYAMTHVDFPSWLLKSHCSWSKDSNWMGYVAVSDDDETRRIGRRDIVVAWRGTQTPSEWVEDVKFKLKPIDKDDDGDQVKVEQGFLEVYTSKSEVTKFNKSSAAEQVMNEVKRLIHLHKDKNGEEVSLTITGHSLGAAIALLNAYEAAVTLPGLPISVISFAGPRVGNIAFRDKLNRLGVKVLRMVGKQDVVPKVPPGIEYLDEHVDPLDMVYTHVGTELKLDVGTSPYLKHKFDLGGFHSLETYLHLIDGFLSSNSPFRENARRDVALVNKGSGMLVDDLRIPESWNQDLNKGLQLNSYGRWVVASREPEDIPPYLINDAITIHNLGSA